MLKITASTELFSPLLYFSWDAGSPQISNQQSSQFEVRGEGRSLCTLINRKLSGEGKERERQSFLLTGCRQEGS